VRLLKNHHTLQSKEAELSNTKSRPISTDFSTALGGFGGELEDEDARNAREERDKQLFGRIRRAKSLFETKSGKKLQRTPTTKRKSQPPM